MAEKLYMTFGESKGKKIAIITDGHFRKGDEETIVLTLTDECKNMKHAKAWFKKMKLERPWETRN